ncbi:MAG: hypothetical protein ACFE0P_06345 [Oceanicaulis sp.]
MSMVESETEAGAGRVEIRDWSLWTKHVRGAPALVALLEGLAEDDVVELVVDGRRGEWVKKKSSASGAPTPGLKPVGRMRDTWFEWFKTRRGDLVSIALAGDAPARSTPANTATSDTLARAPQAERDAAWSAFEALSEAGWRWDGPRETARDDLHAREPI